MAASHKRHYAPDIILMAVIGGAILFPFVVNALIKRWLENVSAANPVPDQGAMVVGFLLFVASIPLAVVTVAVCAGILISRYQKRRRGTVDNIIE